MKRIAVFTLLAALSVAWSIPAMRRVLVSRNMRAIRENSTRSPPSSRIRN